MVQIMKGDQSVLSKETSHPSSQENHRLIQKQRGHLVLLSPREGHRAIEQGNNHHPIVAKLEENHQLLLE